MPAQAQFTLFAEATQPPFHTFSLKSTVSLNRPHPFKHALFRLDQINMSQGVKSCIKWQISGTVDPGPWRFDKILNANSLLHILSLTAAGSSYKAKAPVVLAIEYPTHLWVSQTASDTAPNEINCFPAEVADLQGESFNENCAPEPTSITAQSNIAPSSQILLWQIEAIELPLNAPPALLMESMVTLVAPPRTGFAWTFPGHRETEHVKKINNGSFGEVHMVRNTV